MMFPGWSGSASRSHSTRAGCLEASHGVHLNQGTITGARPSARPPPRRAQDVRTPNRRPLTPDQSVLTLTSLKLQDIPARIQCPMEARDDLSRHERAG
jgi:hypothetical protein